MQKTKKRGAPRGHKKHGGRQLGTKNYATIEREKMREYFEKEHAKFFGKLTEKQIKAAMKTRGAREYSLNQLIGKPKEIKQLTGKVTISQILDEADKE